MPSKPELLSYYAARAHEYEKVYDKPERQADLATLHTMVPEYFDGRRVLEVACGTGYWTRRIAPRAIHVTAYDLVPDVLAVAEAASPSDLDVTFCTGDAFALDAVSGEFDAAFAGFWWSHITHQDLSRFLSGLNRRLPVGSRVLVMDNRYVEGSNWPITRSDEAGNTYQQRRLDDGTIHEVLKNFPGLPDIESAITSAGGQNVVGRALTYYWYASYETGNAPMNLP